MLTLFVLSVSSGGVHSETDTIESIDTGVMQSSLVPVSTVSNVVSDSFAVCSGRSVTIQRDYLDLLSSGTFFLKSSICDVLTFFLLIF